MKYIILYLVSFSVIACPEALRYGSPCFPVDVPNTQGLSVYRDYNDKKCTQSLLNDGVCPDYLVGNCAQRGDCVYDSWKTITVLTNKHHQR